MTQHGHRTWLQLYKGHKGYKGKRPHSRRLTASLFINAHEVKSDHFNHYNTNKIYVHQKMKKIGGPQTTLLASDHPKMAHSSTLGPIFAPKIMNF
eukprot:1143592-Pelagomonas_calceolata.AAC.3